MKKYNRFLNILNILVLVEIIVLNYSIDAAMSLYIYKTFMIIFNIMCIVDVILNMVIAIANFKKNNMAIIQLFIGFFIIISLIINQRIISIVLSGIALFLSVTLLIINRKDVEKIKTKKNLILFRILGSLQILVFIMPIIMNVINLSNLQKVLTIIETQTTIKTDVKKENAEYVFYLKNGKEYKRVQFDEMYINENNNEVCGIVLNGNRLEIGVARNGNKVIIVNSQGEEIFYLCNIFEDYKEVAKRFINYVGKTEKYGIKIVNLK